MKSLISNGIFKFITPSVSKFICFIALILTTMTFQSCDKGNASLEVTVKANGVTVSNFPVTLKSGSDTYTVSSNLNGVALFSDLLGGDYTASWNSTTITFSNGSRITVVAGSQSVSVSKSKVQTATLSIN